MQMKILCLKMTFMIKELKNHLRALKYCHHRAIRTNAAETDICLMNRTTLQRKRKTPQCRDVIWGGGGGGSWVGVILNLHTCMNLFAMQSQYKNLKEHCNVIGCSFGHLTHSLFTILHIYLFTWE